MKNTLFILLLLPFHVFGMDQVTKEYPELTDFFESSEFKRIPQREIGIGDFYDNSVFAATLFEISNIAMTKRVLLNSHYIDRNLITAEELKYIICHELGHLNDKKIFSQLIPLSIGLGVLDIGLVLWTLNSVRKGEWNYLLKKIGISSCLRIAYSFVLAKEARNRETFADEYGINITKNKAAAFSILTKRKQTHENTKYRFNFLNKIKNLFADHPTEDARIAHINSLS